MPRLGKESDSRGGGGFSVVVAEPKGLVRAGLSALLAQETRCEVMGEATGFADIVSVVNVYAPHVLVTDVCFDGVHNYGQLAQLSDTQSGRIRVLVVSDHDEPHVIRETMRAGVCGYLPKDATVEELHTAVCTVADGDSYLHHRLGCLLVGCDVSENDTITAREESVVTWAARGLTTEEVAARLFISARSVESARASIREKVGATTRAEIYTFARQQGFLNSSCSAPAPDNRP